MTTTDNTFPVEFVKQGGKTITGTAIGRMGSKLLISYRIEDGSPRERFIPPKRYTLRDGTDIDTLPKYKRVKVGPQTLETPVELTLEQKSGTYDYSQGPAHMADWHGKDWTSTSYDYDQLRTTTPMCSHGCCKTNPTIVFYDADGNVCDRNNNENGDKHNCRVERAVVVGHGGWSHDVRVDSL